MTFKRVVKRTCKNAYECFVATTIETTTTIEIIISIVVENAFQSKHHIATTIEISISIVVVISIVVAVVFLLLYPLEMGMTPQSNELVLVC